MTRIALLVGPERTKLRHSQEDPSSALRLAALAASWAASQDQTLLVLGDAPALLALGTAALGLQQSRVLEGGERRASPMRVLALLESENSDLDRSLSFTRRSQEAPFDDQEAGQFEEGEGARDIFGDLSLLMDVGVMDLVGESQRSLEPRSPTAIAENLSRQLFEEMPRGVLAFGQVPHAIVQATQVYTEKTHVPFSGVLGEVEGAERIISETVVPILNGRTLRFREQRPLEGDDEDEEVQETADEELMQVARYATWEAEMTFRLYKWLLSLEG